MKGFCVLGLITFFVIVVTSNDTDIPSYRKLLIDSISDETLRAVCQSFERSDASVSKSLPVTDATKKVRIVGTSQKPRKNKGISRNNLPLNFDAREKWKQCSSLNFIQDQGPCWSGWAVAAVSAMTDRFCVQSKGRRNVYFSELDVMTCCMDCGSPCNGGLLKNAWMYGLKTGIVSGGDNGCRPYNIPPCEHNNNRTVIGPCLRTNSVLNLTCQKKCQPSFTKPYKKDLIRLKFVYNLTDTRKIMRDIYRNGPVTTTFEVYEDFVMYKGGVYRYAFGKTLGYQSVKLLGWGEENGLKYWLAANSWGRSWGDNGFFKIVRGINHLGIEDVAYAGTF